MIKYCCEEMKYQLTHECDLHGLDCPDIVIRKYNNDTIGMPIRDGGDSFMIINYCPFCCRETSLLFDRLSEEEKLQKIGWTVVCQSPMTIQDKDGNYAIGLAADIVYDYLVENYRDFL